MTWHCSRSFWKLPSEGYLHCPELHCEGKKAGSLFVHVIASLAAPRTGLTYEPSPHLDYAPRIPTMSLGNQEIYTMLISLHWLHFVRSLPFRDLGPPRIVHAETEVSCRYFWHLSARLKGDTHQLQVNSAPQGPQVRLPLARAHSFKRNSIESHNFTPGTSEPPDVSTFLR